MPNWYISSLLSTSTFAVSRSLIVIYTDDKKPVSEMATTVAFGICIALIIFSLAYTIRWHLIRSFEY
jgi:hypothetical protein